MRLPDFQVVRRVKTNAPITRGNHPPPGIFRRLALQKARSITRNEPATRIRRGLDQRHRSLATTQKRRVVTIIAVDTETPYADARLLELLNPSTSAIQAIIRVQFTAGT
jgi:hypothetical protein